jgi:hypothetical protein
LQAVDSTRVVDVLNKHAKCPSEAGPKWLSYRQLGGALEELKPRAMEEPPTGVQPAAAAGRVSSLGVAASPRCSCPPPNTQPWFNPILFAGQHSNTSSNTCCSSTSTWQRKLFPSEDCTAGGRNMCWLCSACCCFTRDEVMPAPTHQGHTHVMAACSLRVPPRSMH